MDPLKIRHMVIFCLKHYKGSPEEERFLQDSESILSSIPGVKNLEVMRQAHIKNDYDFGIAMEFDNKTAYDSYVTHPTHVDYVQERWSKEVTRSLDIDFEAV